MIRLTLPSGLSIEASDISELEDEYARIGGDKEFLDSHLRRNVKAFEDGSPAVRVATEQLGGELIETTDPDADSQVLDDPWASGPGERQTQAVPPRGPRPVAQQQPAPNRGDPAQYLGEDNFGQKYYRDANAPDCLCGVQSIRKAGRSGPQSKNPGKPYTAFVCFDAGPREAGADYHNKCAFMEFGKGRR